MGFSPFGQISEAATDTARIVATIPNAAKGDNFRKSLSIIYPPTNIRISDRP